MGRGGIVKKGYLKTAFVTAAGATIAGSAGYKSLRKYIEWKDDVDYPAPSGVPLTKDETAFVGSIFGKEINTARIRKYFAAEYHPLADAAALSAEKIKFYGEKNHAADYSLSEDPFKYETFIHEITHIWQHQHRQQDIARFLRHHTKRYDYALSQKSLFKDFGVEQQACIVADYALQFLYPKRQKLNDTYYQPADKGNPPQNLALLQKVVEDKFPQARKTRLALEAQVKAPTTSAPRAP